MPQHGFARDLEFEPLTKLDNFHSYMLKVINTHFQDIHMTLSYMQHIE